jgi:hypothetical protein
MLELAEATNRKKRHEKRLQHSFDLRSAIIERIPARLMRRSSMTFIFYLRAASSGLADTQLRFNPLGVAMVHGPWRPSQIDPWRLSHAQLDPEWPHWETPAKSRHGI